MVRLIKRYESRKLYDTEESRYVSLEEVAEFVCAGQEVRVIDNATSEDVTGQTLAQVILEEGRSGRAVLPTEVLHDMVRFGKRTLSSGVEQVQLGVDRLVQASMDRLGPVRQAREEMALLRSRLEELESSLMALEVERVEEATAPVRMTPQKAPAAKKPATKTPASKKVVKRTSKTASKASK